MTSVYAEVIGDPIAQSKSPLIHKFWLEKLGIAADYRAVRVNDEQLLAYFANRRGDPLWRGCNVTMPLKAAIAPLVDVVDAFAMRAGAINMVSREGDGLRGGNSDGTGFLEPLVDVVRGSARVIGTGGAARGIAVALVDAGFTVSIVGRSLDRAREIAALAGATPRTWDALVPTDAPDLLVNATSLGMTGQPPLALSLANWPRAMAVYDIVTSPLETPLLAEARALDMRSFDGLQMLVGQAAVAFERFFGQPVPREYDADLRKLLLA